MGITAAEPGGGHANHMHERGSFLPAGGADGRDGSGAEVRPPLRQTVGGRTASLMGGRRAPARSGVAPGHDIATCPKDAPGGPAAAAKRGANAVAVSDEVVTELLRGKDLGHRDQTHFQGIEDIRCMLHPVTGVRVTFAFVSGRKVGWTPSFLFLQILE